MPPTLGSDVIAKSLVALGVKTVYGLVGIPVIQVADALQAHGIRFIAFRNEMSAAYAASIHGYLTQRPGVLLVVGGPGVVHAMAGIANSTANRTPLLVLAGSADSDQVKRGAFQELDQVSYLSPHTKFAARPSSIATMPEMLERAYRKSYFGVPGPTYVDLPADFIQGSIDAKALDWSSVKPPGEAPASAGDPQRIQQAVDLLKSAKFPLLIVGKGAAQANAEAAIRNLQSSTQLAFLPTPMGKGVIPDDNECNVATARSQALRQADVVVLLGARLNWILHYGAEPRFHPNVKIIQVDISAEDLGDNRADPSLAILGDLNLVCTQLSRGLDHWKSPRLPQVIKSATQKNVQKAQQLEENLQQPLKYQAVYGIIRQVLSQHTHKRPPLYVSEGANTMDISRSSFPLIHPRSRLDAGTNATMGLGMGYAIAASLTQPDRTVVCLLGDSAFGFTAIEIETAVRSNLPMIVYIMNNSGVYHGVSPELYDSEEKKLKLPATALSLETRYDVLAESLGANGRLVSSPEEIREVTKEAVTKGGVWVINVIIDNGQDKKLEFGWMNKKSKI